MDASIPNVRDGLTTTQRRVLYLAYVMGSSPEKPALPVNELARKTNESNPNEGIDSIYEIIALFSSKQRLRYQLIATTDTGNDFHPDSPKRKFRLTELAMETMDKISTNTVDLISSFCGKTKEPAVLPSRLPLLLLNGYRTGDNKWGMPPHNLAETLDAIIAKIDDPDLDSTELLCWIKGPDFPSGGTIPFFDELEKLYSTGKGTITIRENTSGSDESKIAVSLGAIVQSSDWDSKEPKLETVFTMNLARIIQLFIEHRIEIIHRHNSFLKEMTLARKHILEGQLIGIEHSATIAKTVVEYASYEAAKPALRKLLNLDEIQLDGLYGLFERQKLAQEPLKFLERVTMDLQQITQQLRIIEELLGSRKQILAKIKNELWEIKRKFSDQRRTVIVRDSLANNKKWIVVELHEDGRGSYLGSETDTVSAEVIKDFNKPEPLTFFFQNLLLAFTNQGNVYSLFGPGNLTQNEGRQIFPNGENELIRTVLSPDEIAPSEFLYSVTENGRARLASIVSYMGYEYRAPFFMKLAKPDRLLTVKLASRSSTVLIATRQGRCLRFQLEELESEDCLDKQAISLKENDKIILVTSIESSSSRFLLLVSSDGFGKRIAIEQIPIQTIGRVGTLGIKFKSPKSTIMLAKVVEESESSTLTIQTKSGAENRIKTVDLPICGVSAAGLQLIDPRDRIGSVTHSK